MVTYKGSLFEDEDEKMKTKEQIEKQLVDLRADIKREAQPLWYDGYESALRWVLGEE